LKVLTLPKLSLTEKYKSQLHIIEIGTIKVTVIVTALLHVSAVLAISKRLSLDANLYSMCTANHAVLTMRPSVLIWSIQFLRSVIKAEDVSKCKHI
jgi:hypothetical protein